MPATPSSLSQQLLAFVPGTVREVVLSSTYPPLTLCLCWVSVSPFQSISTFFYLWLPLAVMLASPLPPSFPETYKRSISGLGCRLLYIVINFLVRLSIASSSSFLHLPFPPCSAPAIGLLPTCRRHWSYCLRITPVLFFQGRKSMLCKRKIQTGMVITPPPPSEKMSWSRIALKHWIRTEIRWNKKMVSVSSPEWSESLRPRLDRKAQPHALIGSQTYSDSQFFVVESQATWR